MSGYNGGGVIPPAGDIGGTVTLPRIRDIGGVPIRLTGGALADVLTQQADGSYIPAPGGGGGGGLTFQEFQAGTTPGSPGNLGAGWTMILGSADAAATFLSYFQTVELLSNPHSSSCFYTLGGAFLVQSAIGASGTQCLINFPSWDYSPIVPPTGGPFSGEFVISAMNLTGAPAAKQMGSWQSNGETYNAGSSGTLGNVDFAGNQIAQRGTHAFLGTDSVGESGIITDNTDIWLSAWQLTLEIPAGLTFH